MNILLLSGSFHSKSKTLALLHNISRFLDEHELEIPTLDSLPFYSEDLNREKPEIVSNFLLQVETADALLICTPEYNHSIPAVLKNAIDWASRPAFNSPLKDKPVSIITQAASPVGGARAQAHLKLILDSTLSNIHMCHEMMVTNIDNIFDQNMNVVDTKVLTRLERHVNDFIRFSHNKGRQA
jgi:chromate reductase